MPKTSSSYSSSNASGVSGVSSSWGIDENQSSLTLSGIKNTLFRYYYGVRKDNYHYRLKLSLLTHIIQFLQFFSFSFARAYNWGAGDAGLSYISTIRTFGPGWMTYHGHEILCWLAFLYIFPKTMLKIYVMSRYRKQLDTKESVTIALQYMTHLFLPVLYLPFMYIFGSILICNNGSYALYPEHTCWDVSNKATGSVAIIGFFLIAFSAMLNTVFWYDWYPEKGSYFSMANGRLQVIWYLFTTFAGILDVFVSSKLNVTTNAHLYGWVVIAGNLAILLWTYYFLPFHVKIVNIIVISAFSASLMPALIAYFSTLAGTTGPYAGIAIILIIPSAVAGFFVGRRRADRMYGASIDGEFKRDFQLEIATRYALYDSGSSANYQEILSAFFSVGEQFPESPTVKIGQAVFMMAKELDYHMIGTLLGRAQKLEMQFDLKFLVYSIDKTRQTRVELIDGGTEEITYRLKKAKQHSEACKKNIRTFWSSLLTEVDVGNLNNVVGDIEKHESIAENIYSKLLKKWPKSVSVLRAYASFLEEVKNDLELSHITFALANEIEEEKSKKHSKKKDKKRKNTEKGKKVIAFEETSEEEDMDADRFENVQESLMKPASKNQRMSRADYSRQRQYRTMIEKNRSSALKRISLTIMVTLFVLLADVVFVYAYSDVLITNYKQSLILVNQTLTLTNSGYEMVYDTKKMTLAANNIGIEETNDPEARVNKLKAQHSNHIDSFDNMLRIDLVKATGESTIRDYWYYSNLTEIVASTGPNGTLQIGQSYSSFWAICKKFVNAARIVNGLTFTQLQNPVTIPEWRYIYDNLDVIVGEFDNVNNMYATHASSLHVQFLLVLTILIAASGGVLVLLAVVLFLPSLQTIKLERLDTLKIFLSIPKAAINTIYSRLNGDDEVKEIDDEAFDDRVEVDISGMDSSRNSLPILKQLLIRYFVILATVYLLVVAMFLVEQQYLNKYKWVSSNMVLSDSRAPAVFAVRAQCLELLYGDPYWNSVKFSQASMILEEDAYLSDATGFLYGDAKAPDDAISISQVNDIQFNWPCRLPTNWQRDLPKQPNPDCQGISSLQDIFFRATKSFANADPSELVWNNTAYRQIYLIGDEGELVPWIHAETDVVKNIAFSSIATMQTVMSIVLAVCIPILTLAYFWLTPLERTLKAENARTMKMLLMIPMEVIDAVPAIKEYLETGSSKNSNAKLKQAAIETENRSKSIIDASVDSIVVVNSQVYNPAAEKMFGYTATEMYGKSLLDLIPPTLVEANKHLENFLTHTNRGQEPLDGAEMQAKRKDETTFHVMVSISEGSVGGKTFCAAFIRDTETQDRIDKLMARMFPKSIAQTLQQDIDNPNRPLIVEAYKEVTILFADIVGFTSFSSRVSPRELVFMLNTVFSEWDTLCEKWHLEKIKTVGDCYMCAGGVPERTFEHAKNVLEFALEMFGTLERFNKEHGSTLQIRVGINTGSVVAGVIGNKKFTYDVWGDAVNVASRMESTGLPSHIQVSQTTYDLLKNEYIFEERGKTQVKGKGLMITYLYRSRLTDDNAEKILFGTVNHEETPRSNALSYIETTIDMPSDEELTDI